MAEIKSTIELAMEKTKDLHLSREEMKKLKEEEMKSKAHSLVNRFLEVDFHLKEAEKELLKFTPDERKQLEKLMRQYLSEAIQLDRDNDLIFQGIETFREESKPLIRQIQQLIKKYREQKEKAYEETEKISSPIGRSRGFLARQFRPRLKEAQNGRKLYPDSNRPSRNSFGSYKKN